MKLICKKIPNIIRFPSNVVQYITLQKPKLSWTSLIFFSCACSLHGVAYAIAVQKNWDFEVFVFFLYSSLFLLLQRDLSIWKQVIKHERGIYLRKHMLLFCWQANTKCTSKGCLNTWKYICLVENETSGLPKCQIKDPRRHGELCSFCKERKGWGRQVHCLEDIIIYSSLSAQRKGISFYR